MHIKSVIFTLLLTSNFVQGMNNNVDRNENTNTQPANNLLMIDGLTPLAWVDKAKTIIMMTAQKIDEVRSYSVAAIRVSTGTLNDQIIYRQIALINLPLYSELAVLKHYLNINSINLENIKKSLENLNNPSTALNQSSDNINKSLNTLNKSLANIDKSLEDLKTLYGNLLLVTNNLQDTAQMIIEHMKTLKIEQLPSPYSKELDEQNITYYEQQSRINQHYNAWLAIAIFGNQKNNVSINIRNFNLAISEKKTRDARYFFKEIAEMLDLTLHVQNTQTGLTHNDIIRSMGKLKGSDIKAELMRSVFRTYITTKEKSRYEKKCCIWQPFQCSIPNVSIVVITLCLVALIFLTINDQFQIIAKK